MNSLGLVAHRVESPERSGRDHGAIVHSSATENDIQYDDRVKFTIFLWRSVC